MKDIIRKLRHWLIIKLAFDDMIVLYAKVNGRFFCKSTDLFKYNLIIGNKPDAEFKVEPWENKEEYL